MLDISALPHETRFVVERELAFGERILWLAQPNPRRLMLLALPILLFAIPWTAFSIFWMWSASGFGKPGAGAGIVFASPAMTLALTILSPTAGEMTVTSGANWARTVVALLGLPASHHDH